MDLQICQERQAGPLVKILNFEVVAQFERNVYQVGATPRAIYSSYIPRFSTLTRTYLPKSTLFASLRFVVSPQLPKFTPVIHNEVPCPTTDLNTVRLRFMLLLAKQSSLLQVKPRGAA